MAWRMIAPLLLASAAAACTSQAPAPAPVTMRFNNTMTGQPLSVPPAPIQLVVTRAEFPSGHLIACHRHVWSRYVYLEAGAVRVTNYDAGTVNDFAAGQVLAEAIGQWHDARITSPGPARPDRGRSGPANSARRKQFGPLGPAARNLALHGPATALSQRTHPHVPACPLKRGDTHRCVPFAALSRPFDRGAGPTLSSRQFSTHRRHNEWRSALDSNQTPVKARAA